MSSAPWMNQFNESFRGSQQYRDLMARLGVDTSRGIKLTDSQRQAVKAVVEQMLGAPLPKGVEIDKVGNVNENVVDAGNVAKKVGTYGAMGAAALTGLGAAGIGPLAGMLGGTAGAAGSAAAGTAGTTAGVGSAVAGIAKEAAPSMFSKLLGAAGPALGGAADAMASNRGTALDASMIGKQLDTQARQQDLAERQDARKAALQAAYQADANRGKAPGFSTYSKDVAVPPLDPSIAAAMAADAKRTITTPYTPYQADPKLMNPSGSERALGIGSTVAGIASALPGSIWQRLGRLIK